MKQEGTQEEPRYVGGLLMTGLIALPIVFVWFLLRPGYSRSLRTITFTYALAFPALSLLAYACTGEGM